MTEPRTLRLDQKGLAKVFGELEARVMQAAWSADAPLSVREVHEKVDPALHYNTVQLGVRLWNPAELRTVYSNCGRR